MIYFSKGLSYLIKNFDQYILNTKYFWFLRIMINTERHCLTIVATDEVILKQWTLATPIKVFI